MAYTSIPAEDFVVSSEAVASATWTNGAPTLTNFYNQTQSNARYLQERRCCNGISCVLYRRKGTICQVEE